MKQGKDWLLTNATTTFAVSIRHEGYACRVRVAGIENAFWVLDCLSKSFVFRTSQPIQEAELPAYCTFCVAHGSQISRRQLESLFAAIPGVRLDLDRSPEEVV